MAHDDDKPDAGDDIWSGLDADGPASSEGDLSFSFDEDPAGEPAAEPPVEASNPFVDAFNVVGGEPADDDGPSSATDGAIEDYLNAGDDDAAPSSVLPAGAVDESTAVEAESVDLESAQSSVDIGTGMSGIAFPGGSDAAGSSAEVGADDEEADPFAAMLGDDDQAAGNDIFAIAGDDARGAADGEGGGSESGDDSAEFPGADPAAAARPAGGRKRPPPRRKKKKPSAIGQLVGVVLGGLTAIPITFAILIWGFGTDPFKVVPMVAPMLPDSVTAFLPAKFRPKVKKPDAIDLAAQAAGRDAAAAGSPPVAGGGDLPGDASPAGGEQVAGPGPKPIEPAGHEPGGFEPGTSEPGSTAAGPTDLASVDPFAGAESRPTVADPLADLAGRETGKPRPAVRPEPVPEPKPAPPPEPEPLDLAKLDKSVAAAMSALDAAASLDDPADPTRRKVLVTWYRTLSDYAQELAALESEATETGRPFAPAAERAEAVRRGLAKHPELLESLGPLSRDWIVYTKRGGKDGLVMPATFVSARQLGPYWRSQVTLAAASGKPAVNLVVLTRTEPAVAPGDPVVVTGLAVDDDVVWAVEVRSVTGLPGP